MFFICRYDKKGRKTEEIKYYWDDATSKWVNNVKYTVEYNASNDTTVWMRLQWSEDKNGWVNDQMKEFTWQAKGIKTVQTTSNWKNNDWDKTGEGSWKNSFEYAYTYNSNNDVLTQIRREWSDEKGAMVEVNMVENAYDAKTGVLLRARYCVLSETTKKMELAISTTYYYQGVEPLGIVKVNAETFNLNSDARKFFRNGQILILRDGKTFTLSGQEVE